jgi:3-hydroxyisobutyrate dehydrogenase
MKRIAWIGTGVMGKPMAKHLLDAGYEVSVFNRTISKARNIDPKISVFDDLAMCVKNVDIVFSIVGYPKDVKEIYQVIIESVQPGTILVDMTTSSPTLAKELYEIAKLKNISLLDAPVTGGDKGAIEGTLSIMVGGDQSTYMEILPLLQVLGSRITYMGKAGSGQHAKLANQAAIAGAISGVAEALTYAKYQGLDLNSMLSVITGGSANSWQAQINGAKMIIQDYKPGFYIKHYLKDLNLILEEKDNLPLEIVTSVQKMYDFLSKKGHEDQGTQALIVYYDSILSNQ